MSFLSQVENTRNGELKQRIRMATIIAAVEIMGEDGSTLTPSVHQKRQDLAHKVITTAGLGTPTDNLAMMFVWAVCRSPEITPESTDNDVQFTVNTVWNDCAGVTGSE